MSDVASAFLSIVIILVEHLIFFTLWSSVLQWKKNKALTFIAAFLLLVTISFVSNIFISGTFAKLVIYLMALFAILFILCKNQWYVLMFLAAAGIAYLKAVDNIVLYLSSFILNVTPQASFETPYSFILFALLSKLIEFIGAWCFSRVLMKCWKNEPTCWQSWAQTLPLPIAVCVFLSVALQLSFKQPEMSPQLLLLAGIFLCLCILQLFVAYRLDKQQKSDEENRQLKHALALRKESLHSLTEAYLSQRRITHEFNNFLITITSFVQQENLQGLRNYLEKLNQTTQNTVLAVHTGNAVIDAVVNQKYHIALQHKIDFDFDMTHLGGLPLCDDEFAIVMSNLLDNAIESCAEYDGVRIIRLKIKIHDGQLLLMVTNPSKNAPHKIEGKWITSKSDSLSHGFGLSNVENILDSFKSEYTSEFANGIFSFVAFIPLETPISGNNTPV